MTSPQDGNMPHAAFLTAVQNWVHSRFPTRQMSASDIFYAMQWAEAGIPASILIDGFEAWLRTHPKEFISNANLAVLRFEADRIISEYRASHPQISLPELHVKDPFETALERLEQIGKQTPDEALRDELRRIYLKMRTGQRETLARYPDWNMRAESFYTLKARALLQWDELTQELMDACFSRLPPQTRDELTRLSPTENMRMMRMGEEARQHFGRAVRNKNTARLLGILPILDPL